MPDIKVTYFADYNLRSLWNHNLSDGVWATYVLKFGKASRIVAALGSHLAFV